MPENHKEENLQTNKINHKATNKTLLNKEKKNKNAPQSSPGSQPPNKKQKTQQ